MQASRDLSPEQIQELRALPYEAYLRSAWWFARRNRALREAGFRCRRCDAKRELQVHHRSYQRLGAEQSEDLEVVCRGCHLGHHFNETQDGVAVFVALISDVIRETYSKDYTDVLEEAKARCVEFKIPYNHERFQAAVSQLTSRLPYNAGDRNRELYDVGVEGQPLTRAEAAGALARLGAAGLMKHMPEVKPLTLRQAECRKALRIMAQGIIEQVTRCEVAENAAPDPESVSGKPR